MKAPPLGERFAHDVAGMPCFAATVPMSVIVGPQAVANAVAKDDENCAIANACREQFQCPYVSVGRSRTDIAVPDPRGITKPGYGKTRWVVARFQNTDDALAIVIAADTGQLDETVNGGVFLRLNPARPSSLSSRRQKRNAMRKTKLQQKPRAVLDSLTEMGVRTLTGQRKR